MVDPSLSDSSAWMVAGNITTSRSPSSQTQNTSQTSGSSQKHTTRDLANLTHQLQLLIRLPTHDTDIVIRASVPLKEFAEQGRRDGNSEALISGELARVREWVAHVVGTLKIVEFGLFGG
jgi:hypothetical protein